MPSRARPDPDALLAQSQEDGRGRLKVFLGAAPGVGKTYAMLSAAGRLARSHIDVVVGVVETHGRRETEALLVGLEVLPRRAVSYGSTVMGEFDLDAALARRPALLIVDELAHTNAPDSRHPKRYQDVEELLGAGIDVWTAVNIQHLESLSDVVARITGVTVRETVPDTVIDVADEVVVIDVTPDELIARLGEGRIYRLDTVGQAASGFFKAGNLTALRELALRRTADRVDDEVLDHLRRHAVEGAWPSGERLLVCVGPDAASEGVIRAASRLAAGLNAPWTAVTLEATGHELTDPDALRRVDQALRLAERLGAETRRLSGRELPETALDFARRTNVTQIVIGRSGAGTLARWRGRSLSDAVLRRATDVAVHVVVEGGAPRPRRWRPPEIGRMSLDALAAAAATAVVVGVGLAASQALTFANMPMLFLAGVLVCAVTRGVGSAVLAALLSFGAYNFFFIPPLFTFTVAEPREWLALVVFLAVAVLTGSLAGRVRHLADAARARVAAVQALYDMSRRLAGTNGVDEVAWVLARQAAEIVGGAALLLLPNGTAPAITLDIAAAFPPEDLLEPGERAAADWAFAKAEPAGWRTATLPRARWRFLPIRGGERVVGVLGVAPADTERDLPKEHERQLAALMEQGGVAIERALLATEARANAAAIEREKVQGTLLSSLSHDLRTPLAAILGAASGLRSFGQALGEADRADMLATIEEEARRLSRFVSNLLDMTRVENGGLRRETVDVAETVLAAAARARKLQPARRVELDLPDDLPPVRGDALLLEQVLFNLLDNADRYSPAGPPTRLAARVEGGDVVVAVEDQGIGVPAADLERVFDKFTRLEPGDGRPAGTGLGLAVARGAVMAMGGTIRAESPASGGRGTRFLLRLPAERVSAAASVALEDAL